MKKHKVKRRAGGRHYVPSARMAKAIELVAAGVDPKEAAERVGITYSAVMYRLPGNPSRDAAELDRERKARIGRPPRKPTTARAGSDAKLEAMAERAARGESLFHRDDEPTTEDPDFFRIADREYDRPAMKVVLR